MRFFDYSIRLPAERHRGYLLLSSAVVGGLIPERFPEADVPIYCIVPIVLSGLVGAYWETEPLKRKVLIGLGASCLTLLVRSFTWLFTGFNIFDRFSTAVINADWVWFRAFLLLFSLPLLLPLFALIPMHILTTKAR